MNIYSNSSTNFKANFYKVLKYGQGINVKIMTDNAEQLGEKPTCETRLGYPNKMLYDGKYYTTKFCTVDNQYKIKYEDTGKYENNGIEKSFDYDKLCTLVRKQSKPINLAIIKGNANGLLIKSKNIDKKLLDSKIPLIVIADNNEECLSNIDNTEGFILNSNSFEQLSHSSALCRDYFSFGHLITDEKILEDLNKLEGKFISISNDNNFLKFNEIPPKIKPTKTNKKIVVPQMKRIDKILSLEECEQDTVGNKAYNLKRMKNLVKEGKLKDVIIPNAFVLPHAYLERIEKSITSPSINHINGKNETLTEIKDFAKNIITNEGIILRSAFNGEDLDGYTAAGLYDSRYSTLDSLDLKKIYTIMQSKNKPIAVKSRKRHGITNDEIKPSVIIQDYINSDYSFTTYTESPLDKNKLLIELFINKNKYNHPEPYQITFDKKTNKLAVEKEHSHLTEYIFDENYNLLETSVLKKNHFQELLPILKNLVKNALVLEKEFGTPQDIEGGIKGEKLYFWQTRNIVNKEQ